MCVILEAYGAHHAYGIFLASILASKEGKVSSFRQVGPAFLAAALIVGIAGCGMRGS